MVIFTPSFDQDRKDNENTDKMHDRSTPVSPYDLLVGAPPPWIRDRKSRSFPCKYVDMR